MFFVSCNKDPAQDCQSQSESALDGEGDGCTPGDGGGDVGEVEPEPEDPTGPTDPAPVPDPDVPNEALTFDANIKFFNFDSADEEKVHKAIEIIKKVVASSEFRNQVINHTYNGKKTYVDNGGFTNAQIYQKLLDGQEELLPTADNEMDLELQLYYTRNSTVGYTYPNVLRIYMNTNFFDYYTPSEVAGNIFHEWTHKLGFDHASSYSISRDSSVPYAIGYMIEELGKKYE